jgi:DNA repair exonuclease SbcCD ATPase subunit
LADAAEIEAIRREIEAERAEEARLAELRAALVEAQGRAHVAIEEAAAIANELAAAAEQVAEQVRAMQRLKQEVDRAVNYEAYAVRDGYLDKPTVGGKLAIAPDVITTLIKAAKELCKLTATDWQLADIRAMQRREL